MNVLIINIKFQIPPNHYKYFHGRESICRRYSNNPYRLTTRDNLNSKKYSYSTDPVERTLAKASHVKRLAYHLIIPPQTKPATLYRLRLDPAA